MISDDANLLASLALDRRSDLRENPQWLAQAQRDASARWLVVCEGRTLLDEDGRVRQLGWDELERLDLDMDYVAFLGLDSQDRPHFVLSVNPDGPAEFDRESGARFAGLRRIASRLDRHEAGLAAYARALDLWQRNHRHCGRCGSTTLADTGGFRLRCSNEKCGAEHFPRLDPAVIVIVGHEGRCLLGRQSVWPAGRYSTLAGFVEPGESLEDAVVREVREESGVVVREVHYHSSQPWPFPSSLMVGFVAEAADDRIECGDELEDARWFSPEDLESGVRRGELGLPFKASVSYRLIRHWMMTRHGIDIEPWNAGYTL